MRTEHLDNKINELEALRSRGELTYMGGEMLSEFNEIKQVLTIPNVVFSEAELKAKLEEQKEEIRQWLIGEDFEGLAERL